MTISDATSQPLTAEFIRENASIIQLQNLSLWVVAPIKTIGQRGGLFQLHMRGFVHNDDIEPAIDLSDTLVPLISAWRDHHGRWHQATESE